MHPVTGFQVISVHSIVVFLGIVFLEVDPDLVVHDQEHGIYTVRYEAVNAMLLNEFLKEHRKVEAQAATLEELSQKVTLQNFANADLQQKNAELESRLGALEQIVRNQKSN